MSRRTVDSSQVFALHNFDISQQNDTAMTANYHLPPPSETFTIPLTDVVLLELKLWQHHDIVQNKQPASHSPNAFLIQAHFQDIVRRIYQSQEDGSTHTEDCVVGYGEVELTSWEPYFWLETDAEFVSNIRHILKRFLGRDVDLAPVEPGLSAFARSMTTLTCKDCGVTVRPCVIAIKKVVVEFHSTTWFLPATKSSIEALEKVKVEGLGSMEQCMICLEELPVGVEVIRMPCSHVYHGVCVVQWLERSHFCPLCRFAMPN